MNRRMTRLLCGPAIVHHGLWDYDFPSHPTIIRC
jgi:hypothetical protein